MGKKNSLTQPVMMVKGEGYTILKCVPTENEVLDTISHLQPVLRLFDDKNNTRALKEKTRMVFLTEDVYLSYQATAAYVNKIEKWVNSARSFVNWVEEYSEEELPEDEYMEEEESEDAETNLQFIESQKDFLILNADKLKKNRDISPGEIMSAIMQEQEQQTESQTLMESMHNLFIDGHSSAIDDEVLDKISRMDKEIIIISMAGRECDHYFLKRLVFEQRFEIIRIKKPEQGYYLRLFQNYLQQYTSGTKTGLNEKQLYQKLVSYRGNLFCENDIFQFVDLAVEHAKEKGREKLCAEDFSLFGMEEAGSGRKKLHSLIGLSEVKAVIERQCALQLVRTQMKEAGLSEKPLYRHMAFAGPPGTGKSEVARIYGQIMAEEGITNGKFVTARKCDLVGEYVGHTAPKVAELFRKADGGILFIDEAGALTSNDEFSREAVTELVRFMEERPQTIVIFATYPDTMDMLINLDPGLASRIGKVIQFEPYSDEELIRIFQFMAGQYGFTLEEGYETEIALYLCGCRQKKRDTFGNAREMRKLLEQAIEQFSISYYKKERQKNTGQFCLGCQDIRAAATGLAQERKQRNVIGFINREIAVHSV